MKFFMLTFLVKSNFMQEVELTYKIKVPQIQYVYNSHMFCMYLFVMETP